MYCAVSHLGQSPETGSLWPPEAVGPTGVDSHGKMGGRTGEWRMSHEVHPLPELNMEDSDGRRDWRRAHADRGDRDCKSFIPETCLKCFYLEGEGTTKEEFEEEATP